MAAGHNNSAQQLSQPTVTVTPEVLVSQQVTSTPVRNKHIPLPRTSIPVTNSPATPTLPFTPPNPNDILASPQQIDSSLQRGIAPSQDDPSLQRGHDTHSPESLLDLTAEDDDSGDMQMTPISAKQRRALRSISDFNSKGYTETPISTGVRTRKPSQIAREALELDDQMHNIDKNNPHIALPCMISIVKESMIYGQGSWTADSNSIPSLLEHLFIAKRKSRSNDGKTPRTWQAALARSDREHWIKAIKEEYNAIVRNNTYVFVKDEGQPRLACTWALKIKELPTGEIAKYKARMCIRGDQQIDGVDVFETYAPVVRLTVIRFVLSYIAANDWETGQIDVDNAFLKSNLKEDEVIFMSQPPMFEMNDDQGKPLLCKLVKAMYGLKQAPLRWFETFTELLRSLGGIQSRLEPCLFYFLNKQNEFIGIVVIYVDDVLITAPNKLWIQRFKKDVQKVFAIKDLGEVNYLLGLQVKRDRKAKTLSLSQAKYTRDVLKRFEMETCRPRSTPIIQSGAFDPTDCVDEGQPNDSHLYRAMVGAAQWLSTCTRPDIAYTTSQAAKVSAKPGEAHFRGVRHLLRYLQNTKDTEITYGTQDERDSNVVFGYSDADWGADPETRRSTSGYVFMMNGGPISWGSKAQPTVSLSSTEAEYKALCLATQEAVYLRELYNEFFNVKEKDGEPIEIWVDNQSAIHLAGSSPFSGKTKHIELKYHFVKDMVNEGFIKVSYVPTTEQYADVLTKPLSVATHEYITKLIFGSGFRAERRILHTKINNREFDECDDELDDNNDNKKHSSSSSRAGV
jgi:hypothetical protein